MLNEAKHLDETAEYYSEMLPYGQHDEHVLSKTTLPDRIPRIRMPDNPET